jgi:hypothetical protein
VYLEVEDLRPPRGPDGWPSMDEKDDVLGGRVDVEVVCEAGGEKRSACLCDLFPFEL